MGTLAATERSVGTFSAAQPRENGYPAYSADGQLLAVNTSQGIEILKASSGELIRSLGNRAARAEKIIFSPDGRRLAASSGILAARVEITPDTSGLDLLPTGSDTPRFDCGRRPRSVLSPKRLMGMTQPGTRL